MSTKKNISKYVNETQTGKHTCTGEDCDVNRTKTPLSQQIKEFARESVKMDLALNGCNFSKVFSCLEVRSFGGRN